jgi:hypothetical protein
VTHTAICGSDLHLYDGFIPTMHEGDILGHEFMGEIMEVGPGVRNLQVGDRVVVPFTIACGACFFCERGLTSLCDRSNPNAAIAREAMGQSPSGLFGYSHMLGGFSGGQAEYVRVPYADVGPVRIPHELTDEQVGFYRENGYLAPLPVLRMEQVEELRGRLEKMTRADFPRADELVNPPRLKAGDKPGMIYFQGAWGVDDLFRALVFSPRLTTPLCQLLGTTAVRFFHDQIFYKPPRHGGIVNVCAPRIAETWSA